MRLTLRFLGFLFTAGTILFLVGVTAVAGLLWHFSKELPDYSQLQDYEPAVMTRVHASDGALLAEYAHERRLRVPLPTYPFERQRYGIDGVETDAPETAEIPGLEKKADLTKTLVYFMGIDEAKFRRPIVPGDQMRIVVEVIRRKAIVWKMKGEVYVGSEMAAEAILLSSIGQQP